MQRTTISRLEFLCTRYFSSGSSSRLRIFNSLTKTVTLLNSTSPTISWYACGPTVYDDAHIGHARTYVSLDILRRIVAFLTQKPVIFAMNITDIDDKILRRASELGENPLALARRYEKAFFEDMALLGVQPPTTSPRVSEHIEHIIAYIQTIESRGLAYKASDGSGVYMDTRALAAKGYRYGQLAPRSIEEAAAAEANDSIEKTDSLSIKKSSRDFALWKIIGKSSNNDISSSSSSSMLSWDSPWGKGRPGWHIECSAMAHNTLGGSISIHAGGADLAFPHHCNEIAQAQAYYANAPTVEWVGHWVHTGHVHIQGRKMSKSLKNFITIREMIKSYEASSQDSTSFSPTASDVFRMFCLQHHYSSNLTYSTISSLRDASNVLKKLQTPLFKAAQILLLLNENEDKRSSQRTIKSSVWKERERDFAANVSKSLNDITECCCHDFDTPGVLRSFISISSLLTKYIDNYSIQGQGRETDDDDHRIDAGLLFWSAKALASQLNSFGFSCATSHINELEVAFSGEYNERLEKSNIIKQHVLNDSIKTTMTASSVAVPIEPLLQKLITLVTLLRQNVRQEAVNLNKEAVIAQTKLTSVMKNQESGEVSEIVQSKDNLRMEILMKLLDSTKGSSIKLLKVCDDVRKDLHDMRIETKDTVVLKKD